MGRIAFGGTHMKPTAIIISLVCVITTLLAQSLPLGTWVRRPNNDGINSTMIIEPAGSGRKISFKIQVPGSPSTTMVVTTRLDGKDAAALIDGRPSGQTMAIRMVDDRHAINVIKLNGSTVTTQKSEVSADGKVIKVESTASSPQGQSG